MMMSFPNLYRKDSLTDCDSNATPNYSRSTSSGSLNESICQLKFKKDALEHVDKDKEYKVDPKYKTELCKKFTETGFCAYGNKCRFAHGKRELFDKIVNCKNYKQKECMSFLKNKYCCYGSRCHFKHDERKLNQIERSYHTIMLSIYDDLREADVERMGEKDLEAFNPVGRRLQVLKEVTGDKSKDYSCSNKIISSLRYLNKLENYNNDQKFTLSYSNHTVGFPVASML
jgi:hypothetical protein